MRVTNSGMSVNKTPTPMYGLATASSEALRQGHQGPAVKELQQQLNAAGARPPLAVDGIFGPKTLEALKSLTGSTVFDAAARAALAAPSQSYTASGFSDSPTRSGPVLDPRASLASPVEHAEAVSQAEPPSGSVADRIIANAKAEDDSINPMKAGDDGRYKGWKQLQTVFEKTTGWRPTDSECQTITPGRGVLPGGKSWCGIWACHILQQSGVDVKWDLTRGKMVGDVTHVVAPSFTTPAQYKAERAAFEQSIRPGDVITVKGSTNHHAIVTKVNPDGTLETMDGNKPHVGPGRAKLSDVTTYYRPNKD